MTPPVAAPASVACPARTLAENVAALLPVRAGVPWTVEPYSPWWTARHPGVRLVQTARHPGVRLVQGERALVLVANGHAWTTEIGWQLPAREPTRPDLTLKITRPDVVAREILRLVLPVLDDEAAAAREDVSRARLELLYEIGTAIRAQGAATYERGGLLVNTSTVTWSSSGLRYSATLHGTSPVCDVQATIHVTWCPGSFGVIASRPTITNLRMVTVIVSTPAPVAAPAPTADTGSM